LSACRAGILIASAVGALHAPPIVAQPQASQHASVSQIVNTTTITVEYDRPVLHGRSVFGDILDYDAVWTPGANRATWIELSAPAFIEGRAVPSGRYGVWMIPHESEPWDVILVTEWDTHHSFFPADSELLRVRASPETSSHMEALAFDFPEVGPYETTLRFHWGEIAVPLSIAVDH
jgi:Protein of unknown function (DUF2911)